MAATRTAPTQPARTPEAKAPHSAPPVEPPGLIDAVLERTLERVRLTAEQCVGEIEASQEALRKAVTTAKAIAALDSALTPEFLETILPLMDSPLGFMTDRPPGNEKGRYDAATVKRCVIEALLSGVKWTGNEFNIIAGRLYIAQAGWERKVRELPDSTYPDLSFGVPREDQGRTVIRVGARWTCKGKTMEFRDHEDKPGKLFVVNAYKGTTADNIQGKAKRKALKLIWEQSTGKQLPDQDDEPAPLTAAALAAANDARSGSDKLADRLTPTAPVFPPRPADAPGDADEGPADPRGGMFQEPEVGPHAERR